eukprot:278524-Hanusia_phi.AAC.4
MSVAQCLQQAQDRLAKEVRPFSRRYPREVDQQREDAGPVRDGMQAHVRDSPIEQVGGVIETSVTLDHILLARILKHIPLFAQLRVVACKQLLQPCRVDIQVSLLPCRRGRQPRAV